MNNGEFILTAAIHRRAAARPIVVACIVVCLLVLPSVHADGLQMQFSFGLTDPLSPRYLADYWNYGAEFSFGLGSRVNDRWAFSLQFSQRTYDYAESIEPIGGNAQANLLLLQLKTRLFREQRQRIKPYAVCGGGLYLLKTPAIYRDDGIFGQFLPENRLEDARRTEGFAVQLGAGVEYLLQQTSALFAELHSAAALSRGPGRSWGVRAGLLFSL